jgi:uncharacterized cupredoxin-like copper-binding protein
MVIASILSSGVAQNGRRGHNSRIKLPTSITVLKNTLCVSLFCLCFVTTLSHGAENIISDDGREIRLNDDGSWEYLSADRFATSASGKRVRLMESGQWELTGELALPTATHVAKDVKVGVGEQAMEVQLARLSVETKRGKKSESHKSTSKKTQTVFTLNLSLEKSAKAVQRLSVNERDFKVEDSGGREYDVISVTPEQLSILPGEEASIVVRVDGSPHWFTTKAMSIVIDKSALDSDKDVELTKAMSDAKKLTVDEF